MIKIKVSNQLITKVIGKTLKKAIAEELDCDIDDFEFELKELEISDLSELVKPYFNKTNGDNIIRFKVDIEGAIKEKLLDKIL